MNVYLIMRNGSRFYISASSSKSAMMKKFGVSKVAGSTIKKVGAVN